MSTEEKPYVGDVGTEIKIDMQESMAAATNVTFEVKKPNGDDVVWTGVQIVEITKLKYTTQAGDLNQSGIYKIQPKLTMGMWTGRGTMAIFRVYELFT